MSRPIEVECDDFGVQEQWFPTEWDEEGNATDGQIVRGSVRRFRCVGASGETLEFWSVVDANLAASVIGEAHAQAASHLRAKAAGTAQE